MQLTISDVEHAPEELHGQTPLVVDLLREIPGDDRPDYWLGSLHTPIRWLHEGRERRVTHLVLAARWVGTRIAPGVARLPVGIAYVTDPSLLEDPRLDLAKCSYVAIGMSHDSSASRRLAALRAALARAIRRLLGRGSERGRPGR